MNRLRLPANRAIEAEFDRPPLRRIPHLQPLCEDVERRAEASRHRNRPAVSRPRQCHLLAADGYAPNEGAEREGARFLQRRRRDRLLCARVRPEQWKQRSQGQDDDCGRPDRIGRAHD